MMKTFKSHDEYINHFKKLIELEQKINAAETLSARIKNVKISYLGNTFKKYSEKDSKEIIESSDNSDNHQTIWKFILPTSVDSKLYYEGSPIKVLPADEENEENEENFEQNFMVLKDSGNSNKKPCYNGYIQSISIKHPKTVIIVLFKIEKDHVKNVNIAIDSNHQFQRMKTNIEAMRFHQKEEYVADYFLDANANTKVYYPESELDVEKTRITELEYLNNSQKESIIKSLDSKFSLIQGPPGTGKTTVSCEIIKSMVKLSDAPVLVCAASNNAVNILAQKLSNMGLKVARLASNKAIMNMNDKLKSLLIETYMLDTNIPSQLIDDIKMYLRGYEISRQSLTSIHKRKSKMTKSIIENAQVVCCTCSMSGSKALQKSFFPCALVDESTQAIEPECILPFLHQVLHGVIVGDHKQLGPVVKSPKAAELKISLFERIAGLHDEINILDTQYRMDPAISVFPGQICYNGKIKDGTTSRDKVHNRVKNFWPVKDLPMIFWHTKSTERLDISSYYNKEEGNRCVQVVNKLLKDGIKPSEIGIITPYQGQKNAIIDMISNVRGIQKLYEGLMVDSVDSYQGREKDYIIFSCVRSNSKNEIGFLQNVNRLNVAITRAKFGLIIIGNAKCLMQNDVWNDLIRFYQYNKCLVQGNLMNFTQINWKIPVLPSSRFKIKDGVYTFSTLDSVENDTLVDNLTNYVQNINLTASSKS